MSSTPREGDMKIINDSAATLSTSDGVSLLVQEDGSPDAPVTVVLVHGWTLSQHTWDRVVDGLPQAVDVPVRMVRFDLRGHGGSGPAPAGTATIERCADDLAELIAERVPRGPIVLAGHSMGAMSVMALAQRHHRLFAERVAGAALVATSSGDLRRPSLGLPAPIAALSNHLESTFVRERLRTARGSRLSRGSRWMRPGLRWLLFGKRSATADLAATADWVAACHPASMAGFRTSLAQHERGDALAALRSVPTVVLAGLADRLTPATHARRIAEALPDAKLLLYPGAGHMLPLERDDEVTARIASVVTAATR